MIISTLINKTNMAIGNWPVVTIKCTSPRLSRAASREYKPSRVHARIGVLFLISFEFPWVRPNDVSMFTPRCENVRSFTPSSVTPLNLVTRRRCDYRVPSFPLSRINPYDSRVKWSTCFSYIHKHDEIHRRDILCYEILATDDTVRRCN